MPAPLAPFVGFVFGVIFAWASSDELARSHTSPIGSRGLVVVALFAAIVFTPIVGYFLAFEADWSFAYFADARHVPSAAELGLALLDLASVPLGFVVAAPAARSRQLAFLLGLVIVPTCVVLAALVMCASRLSIEATYAQFHGDFGTRQAAGSTLGYALLWMDGLLVLGAAWTVRELREMAKPTPPLRRTFARGSTEAGRAT